MEKNMQINFKFLKERVIDALNSTNLDKIRFELKKIDAPTLVTGVGGSNVVSCFTSKVLSNKNKIIATNHEPRDLIYDSLEGYKNVLACSYSGNNYGVDLAFRNNLKHYLLSNHSFDNPDVTYLEYKTNIEEERSFISLAATLIPINIMLNYYDEDKTVELLDDIYETHFDFEDDFLGIEIFSGSDTSTTSIYLESTLTESGLALPIVHDKYGYCHGRSTLSTTHDNIAIYLNNDTELDRKILPELPKYYKDVIVISSKEKDPILRDYQMLINAMYLTKSLAEKQNQDLSDVNYSSMCKKLYKYKGEL